MGRENISPETDAAIEDYLCSLYGRRRTTSVNNARHKIFRANYYPRNKESPLEKIKGANETLFPPPKVVLNEKLKRSNLVAYL